jgi:hypothetical protein
MNRRAPFRERRRCHSARELVAHSLNGWAIQMAPMLRQTGCTALIALLLSACGSASVVQTNSSPQGQPPPTGSAGKATLIWTPVTQNADGTVLLNLAGYKVHYGASAGDLSSIIQIDDPTDTTYEVDGLDTGTWYFAVSAYTTDGIDGELSNIGQKTVGSSP